MSKILVTGGAGYIGSHTIKKLIKAGNEVLVLDDLSFGKKELVLEAKLVVGDVGDILFVNKVLDDFKPEAVMHFAAFKNAPESVLKPEIYFYNNTSKSIAFLNCLLDKGINNFIFSSTAAVYGDVDRAPITEEFETKPANPYGISKLMIENVLLELKKAHNFKSISLRYFNAGGADPEGEIGNLYPGANDVISKVTEAALGKIPSFEIFGADYDTRDGSCIRDIIHVDDLAEAHLNALGKLLDEGKTGIFNLGSQEGYSIKEIVKITKEVTGADFEVKEAPRRKGDVIVSIASSKKAEKELGWKKKYGLEDIIRTSWEWKKNLNSKEKSWE